MALSWGRYFRESIPAKQISVGHETDLANTLSQCQLPMLPYGLGRSYGDSCLNSSGALIHSKFLNRVLSFDRQQGIIHAEAGCSLREVSELAIPSGFFLPVTPGTQFVTLGGAVANDVHGKNHHTRGCFGRHILEFRIWRSDRQEVVACSPTQNSELFQATIGGLGLTGFIVDLKLQLIKGSPWIDEEIIKFSGLKEYRQITEESDTEWEYTVSWVDCLKQSKDGPRGLFMRGKHSLSRGFEPSFVFPKSIASIPIEMPQFLLNQGSIAAFNFLYYNKQLSKMARRTVSYGPFFYPLDILEGWNKIYGKRGFFQVQFVVPTSEVEFLKDIFALIARSGDASFLAVLKDFGDLPSPGWMSFPVPGVTLALDFANKGKSTFELISRIYDLVLKAGGRVYPAKDAAMASEMFYKTYSQIDRFAKLIDPKFSSDFWRRVKK